jgi:hypothetical protein
MEFLHLADSASHVSLSGAAAWLATVVGIATGGFVVFGLPAIFRRQRIRNGRGLARRKPDQNT